SPSVILSGSALNIEGGATLTAYNIIHGGGINVLKIGTGTLTLGGVLADANQGAGYAIKQGTVVMNRPPGVVSVGGGNPNTILLGDDIPGDSATLIDMHSQQLDYVAQQAVTMQIAS